MASNMQNTPDLEVAYDDHTTEAHENATKSENPPMLYKQVGGIALALMAFVLLAIVPGAALQLHTSDMNESASVARNLQGRSECQTSQAQPYSLEACKAAAQQAGLKLGDQKYGFSAFSGNFGIKGCYTYSSGKYKGSAFYGTGGTLAQRTEIPKSPKLRVQGHDQCGGGGTNLQGSAYLEWSSAWQESFDYESWWDYHYGVGYPSRYVFFGGAYSSVDLKDPESDCSDRKCCSLLEGRSIDLRNEPNMGNNKKDGNFCKYLDNLHECEDSYRRSGGAQGKVRLCYWDKKGKCKGMKSLLQGCFDSTAEEAQSPSDADGEADADDEADEDDEARAAEAPR